MTSRLENLATIGSLKKEPPDQEEFDGLVRSGSVRLADAIKGSDLSLDSRFDLAYNAAHALALAALRFRGYRSENRYLVFQTLQETIGLPIEKWRVLDKAHNQRNRSEYEGHVDLDTAIVEALVRVASELESLVRALGAVPA